MPPSSRLQKREHAPLTILVQCNEPACRNESTCSVTFIRGKPRTGWTGA